jgi:hypothetical protein
VGKEGSCRKEARIGIVRWKKLGQWPSFSFVVLLSRLRNPAKSLVLRTVTAAAEYPPREPATCLLQDPQEGGELMEYLLSCSPFYVPAQSSWKFRIAGQALTALLFGM